MYNNEQQKTNESETQSPNTKSQNNRTGTAGTNTQREAANALNEPTM